VTVPSANSDLTGMVVLGAGGLLAGALVREAELRSLPAVGLTRAECDVTRVPSLREAIGRAHESLCPRGSGRLALINCAAYTAVDRAEVEAERAWRVNALGAEQAARVAEQRGLQTIYISTDFVFGGHGEAAGDPARQSPYDELDVPAAVGSYGRSKFAGEVLSRQAAPTCQVVRVAGLYGRGGRNFASSLAERLRLQARPRGDEVGEAAAPAPLRLDAQRVTSPTWAVAAARRILDLAQDGRPGTYHAACAGQATWLEVAVALAALLGIPAPALVAATPAELVAMGARAPRPAYCALRSRVPELRGLTPMPSWRQALSEYVALEYGPLP
jgi:dTDP-4-dehydrorhamnose reductase